MIVEILIGILWGVFVTHNVEQTDYFKCKYDKIEASCMVLEADKTKKGD